MVSEKIEYYATLLTPYVNKYGHVIPITKKFKVSNKANLDTKVFYESFGKDARYTHYNLGSIGGYSDVEPAIYPDNFTELDYVLNV